MSQLSYSTFALLNRGEAWWPGLELSSPTGVGAWIAREPRLSDAFLRRISSGSITGDEVRAALCLTGRGPSSSGADVLTSAERDLLRRMATIIAEELGIERRDVGFGPYVDLWREEPR